ncbi:DsbA family protein [Photobacterium sanctipauli]|uniref:DsbA family protein n=1 Tax=Photobacterium sanctipauli TaxID=1342794 RepID=A0A2T3NZ63_9GAMM|nr:DsbA family protein [Photobacterium sanctipauli]PSW21508.1 DsbA family protein [Photobacterium sanctipauli]
MKKTFIAVALATASLVATPTIASELTQQQQTNLGKIESLLADNPELIDGLLTNLNMYLVQQDRQAEMLAKYQDWIFKNPSHTTMGNDDATLTIVNVTDYNCPFCKKLDPVLAQLAEEMPNDVRVVNIYVPLKKQDVEGLGTTSAEFALNVWQEQRESYDQVHQLLVRRPQMHDKSSLTRIADATGTKASLERQQDTRLMIDKNYQMFTELGMRGTPAMIIGDEIIGGYMPIDRLRPIVEDQLKKLKSEKDY